MGSYIVKASHVGISARTKVAYPSPATDEEMEIARRAAEYTKKRKPNKKKKSKKKPNKLKSGANNSAEKSSKISFYKKSNEKVGEVENQSMHDTPRSSATTLVLEAKKLGITERELKRKINAVKKWRSENK